MLFITLRWWKRDQGKSQVDLMAWGGCGDMKKFGLVSRDYYYYYKLCSQSEVPEHSNLSVSSLLKGISWSQPMWRQIYIGKQPSNDCMHLFVLLLADCQSRIQP